MTGESSSVGPSVRTAIRRLEMPPFDPLNRRAGELRQAGHAVISLGQAVPYFSPPPAAIAAARAAVDAPDVHRYTTDQGLPSLRAAYAARLAGEYGQPVRVDDVVVTAGANHAFTLAVSTLVDPGDAVVLPSPYFTNHQMAVVAAGAVAVEAPIADRVSFAPRWDDIEPWLSARTRAVVLCNPGNPTGTPIAAADGARIVAELGRRGIFVISDETYMQFVYDGAHWSAASVDGWRAHVVVVGTCSKSFGMMGWRVGFLLADAAICAEAVKVQDAMIICAPTVAQHVAEVAVRDHWSYPTGFHAALRGRRAALAAALAGSRRLSWVPARGGLFGFARVDGCRDSGALAHDLLERAHVVTIPGRTFGESGEGYLRLSFGYAGEDEIHEAGRRLVAFVDGAGGP